MKKWNSAAGPCNSCQQSSALGPLFSLIYSDRDAHLCGTALLPRAAQFRRFVRAIHCEANRYGVGLSLGVTTRQCDDSPFPRQRLKIADLPIRRTNVKARIIQCSGVGRGYALHIREALSLTDLRRIVSQGNVLSYRCSYARGRDDHIFVRVCLVVSASAPRGLMLFVRSFCVVGGLLDGETDVSIRGNSTPRRNFVQFVCILINHPRIVFRRTLRMCSGNETDSRGHEN